MQHIRWNLGRLEWHALGIARCGRRLSKFVVTLVLIACGSEERNKDWPDWQRTPNGKEPIALQESVSTCGDCIRLGQMLLISDNSRAGAVDESPFVALDSLGRIWSATYNGYKVYDSRGQYVSTVGRFGGGPLEFTAAGPIYTDAIGRMHAFDPAVYREQIINKDFDLIETRKLPLGAIEDVAALSPDGQKVLVNAEFLDPQLFASAVHELVGGNVTRSFATATDSVFSVSGGALSRKIAVDLQGRFVIAKKYVYEFDVVSPEGNSLLSVRRAKVWPSPPGGVPKPLSPDDELWGVIHDIEIDSAGRVWVLSWNPKPNWRDFIGIRSGPDGAVDVYQKDDSESLYSTRIEVFDIRKGKVLAAQTFPTMIWGFLGPSKAFGFKYAETGEPQLAVFHVSLHEPSNQ